MFKRRHLGLIIGSSLIVLGLILGLPTLLQLWQSGHVTTVTSPFATQSVSAQAPVAPNYIEGTPVRIQIPSLNIDLPVINGYYNTRTRQWTLTKDKVQYATLTPKPNNTHGNTFLYGHNRQGVFNTLARIKPGATVVLTTDNGHTFTYTFRGAIVTNPNDDSLFQYQGVPILTIQTCSGAWFQNRQLFTFDLKAVQ